MSEAGSDAALGSFCQISSLANGTNGCSRRRLSSSTVASMPWVRKRRRSSPEAERRLGQLDVPVAQLVPHEVVDGAGRLAEAELAQRRVHRRRGALHARQDPALGQRQADRGRAGRARQQIGEALGVEGHRRRGPLPWRLPCAIAGRRGHAQVHEREARRVPHLVDEVARALDALGRQADAPRRRGHRGQGEAQRVGPVRLDALRAVLLDVLDGRFVAVGARPAAGPGWRRARRRAGRCRCPSPWTSSRRSRRPRSA